MVWRVATATTPSFDDRQIDKLSFVGAPTTMAPSAVGVSVAVA